MTLADAVARHIGHLLQYSRHASYDLVSGCRTGGPSKRCSNVKLP
jgi:hypothetical protein